MRLIMALLFFGVLTWVGMGDGFGQPVGQPLDRSARLHTGTIQDLDASELKLTLKTDLEKAIFVKVVRPDLMKELTAGDRVTVELDENGLAHKITKVGAPELRAPPGSQ